MYMKVYNYITCHREKVKVNITNVHTIEWYIIFSHAERKFMFWNENVCNVKLWKNLHTHTHTRVNTGNACKELELGLGHTITIIF